MEVRATTQKMGSKGRLSGFGYVPTAIWNDARVAEEAPLLRVQSCKRLVSSNLTHSLHNQITIVESLQCLEVRVIERFPTVVLGRTRPGRMYMWCMYVVDNSNALSTPCRPSERLDRLDSDGHRQCAKTHHRSRTGLHFIRFDSSVGRALD